MTAIVTKSRSETAARWLPVTLIALAFAILTGYSTFAHEMWLDEMQAWLIATDTSLSDLFGLLHYEAHPGAWHLLLRLASLIAPVPEATQVLHWLIAVSAVLLFCIFAPFSLAEKFLLVFGYYQGYEYSVISRNYGPGWFFLVLALIFYTRQRHISAALSAFVMVHCNVFVWIIALAFLSAQVALAIARRIRQNLPALALCRSGYVALAIVAIGLATSFYSMYPAPDYGFHLFAEHQHNIRPVLFSIGWAFVPAVDPTIWFARLNGYHHMPSDAVSLLLSLAICVWIYRVFIADIRSGLFLTIAATGILLFFLIFYTGQVRHHGHLFLAFIAALWLKRMPESRTERERVSLTHAVFFLLLGLQFLQGLAAHFDEFRHPFSQGKQAAAYLRQDSHRNAILVADPDYAAVTISGYLGKKIYSPKTGRWQSYMVWNRQSPGSLRADTLLAAARTMPGSAKVLVIVAGKARADAFGKLGPKQLAAFEGSLARDQDFFIFEARSEKN